MSVSFDDLQKVKRSYDLDDLYRERGLVITRNGFASPFGWAVVMGTLDGLQFVFKKEQRSASLRLGTFDLKLAFLVNYFENQELFARQKQVRESLESAVSPKKEDIYLLDEKPIRVAKAFPADFEPTRYLFAAGISLVDFDVEVLITEDFTVQTFVHLANNLLPVPEDQRIAPWINDQIARGVKGLNSQSF